MLEERRQGNIEIIERLARIEERLIAVDRRVNGSIDSVEKHIEQGTKWRVAIVCAFIGLVGLLSTSLLGFGKITKSTEENFNRLDRYNTRLITLEHEIR